MQKFEKIREENEKRHITYNGSSSSGINSFFLCNVRSNINFTG